MTEGAPNALGDIARSVGIASLTGRDNRWTIKGR
jgi:hypothetical protein